MVIPQTGYSVNVQDHYNLSNTRPPGFNSSAERKFALVKSLLDEAKAAKQDKWFINFSSALVLPTLWPPELKIDKMIYFDAAWLAQGFTKGYPGVNFLLQQYFANAAPGGYGTIVMDYPEAPQDLIMLIIRSNFKLT